MVAGMATRQGSDAESPAADDELEVDAAAEVDAENPPAEAQPEDEGVAEPQDAPPAEQADAEAPEPEDDQPEPPKAAKDPKPKERKPSPVDEAIAHLTTPEKAPNAPNPAAKKPTDSAKGEQPAAKDQASAPPAPGAQPNDEAAEDALKDWSPEERKHTKGRVKERFRKLHQERQVLEPLAEIGREWAGVVHRENLREDLEALPDEGIPVAIRTQAAAIRVATAARSQRAPAERDVTLLLKNREAIDEVLGMAGRAPKAAEPEDHSGIEITEAVRDLKDAFGVLKDEDEMRAVQAALNRIRAKKAHAAAKPATPAAPAPIAPPAAAVQTPAPAAPARAWSDEDERLAKVGMSEDLVRAGVPANAVTQHYSKNLAPLIANRVAQLYPGNAPDAVWGRLSPVSRRELVREAQSAWAKARQPAPPRAPTRAPQPPPVQGTGVRPALARAGAGRAAKPVDAAIAFLSGEEAE